jgi:GNAT superfamily N-acetyltransferase
VDNGYLAREKLMSIVYRQARLNDLQPAMGLVKKALNDLEIPHGFDGIAGELGTSFVAYILVSDATGVWVAESGGQLVGYACSWLCGDLWFLADLFIDPAWQAKGIGRALMTRTLQQAEASDAKVRALITFAYNRSSLSLYISHGLYPRIPLYQISIPVERLAPLDIQAQLDHSRIDLNSDKDSIDQIDCSALGVSRLPHHRYSLENSMNGYLLTERTGKFVGYAYISNEGHIGPLAITSGEFVGPAFRTAVRLAMETGAGKVSAFVPGIADQIMQQFVEFRMKLGRTMVLLSSTSFGDWTRYCPRDPGFM